MWENLAQFDILGVGVLLGALLYLGILIWFLVGNRSFEGLERRRADPSPRAVPSRLARATETENAEPKGADHGKPSRPGRKGRAA